MPLQRAQDLEIRDRAVAVELVQYRKPFLAWIPFMVVLPGGASGEEGASGRRLLDYLVDPGIDRFTSRFDRRGTGRASLPDDVSDVIALLADKMREIR